MTGVSDWNTIVPGRLRKRVDFIADELARSIRQAEIVATENKPGAWFKFEKGKVNITAAGDATGQSNVELPLTYDSEPSEFRLDSRFLNEFLEKFPPRRRSRLLQRERLPNALRNVRRVSLRCDAAGVIDAMRVAARNDP